MVAQLCFLRIIDCKFDFDFSSPSIGFASLSRWFRLNPLERHDNTHTGWYSTGGILLINFIASSRVMKHYTLAELRYASFRISFKFNRVIDRAWLTIFEKYRSARYSNFPFSTITFRARTNAKNIWSQWSSRWNPLVVWYMQINSTIIWTPLVFRFGQLLFICLFIYPWMFGIRRVYLWTN